MNKIKKNFNDILKPIIWMNVCTHTNYLRREVPDHIIIGFLIFKVKNRRVQSQSKYNDSNEKIEIYTKLFIQLAIKYIF
jgi:hypothetical protein